MNRAYNWDNWLQAWIDWVDLLMPTQESVSNEEDHRVICRDCETLFNIKPARID